MTAGNDAIHMDKTAESHPTVTWCTKEVSVAAYELVAKGCDALVAIYDTVMTLVELVMGACRLLWAVVCLAFAIGK